MKCSESEILLQLAADGELIAAERIALDGHLDQCVACRRKEAWLDLLSEQFESAWAGESVDEIALADQVVAALGQTVSRPEPDRRAVPARRKKRKSGILSRMAKAALKRALGPAPSEKKAPRDPTWVDASLSALQPPPTSLEGFRALRGASRVPMNGVRQAGQGVSSAVAGSVNGVRWALEKLGRRGRS